MVVLQDCVTRCQYVCVSLQHSEYLLSVCVRCVTAQCVPTVSMCALHYSTVRTYCQYVSVPLQGYAYYCQYVCFALQHSAYLLSVCVRCITAQCVPTVSMCPSRYRAMRTTVSMCALRYSTVRTYCQYVRVPLQGNAYLMSEWKWSYSSTHS